MDFTSSLEAKFGARSGQVHEIRGKLGKFRYHKTQKLGKSPNFGVISEIQRAKFGVSVTYIFEGKILFLFQQEFQRQIFRAKPPNLLIWKYPLGLKRGNMLHVFDLVFKNMQHCCLLELFQIDQSFQWHVTLERFLMRHRWKSYRCKSSGVTFITFTSGTFTFLQFT